MWLHPVELKFPVEVNRDAEHIDALCEVFATGIAFVDSGNDAAACDYHSSRLFSATPSKTKTQTERWPAAAGVKPQFGPAPTVAPLLSELTEASGNAQLPKQ
jgi:hypothetical protein